MSGIAGIFSLDGNDPTLVQIEAMTARLLRRGSDGTHLLVDRHIALGHTLLATTPEALVETLPLTHGATGCAITADARLDNREQLINALDLASETRTIGDGELILRAYLEWGEHCPERLLGDFAFAIWDPRSASVLCARDQMGMRQLTYHRTAQRSFVFATEPEAILALPEIDAALNEGRVTDFLSNMEGADFHSTFFREIHRLPPGHILKVDRGALVVLRYWQPTLQPVLDLPSDKAYADAFLTVFTEAVRCRMRSNGRIGAMVSGGIDSNAVAAVAAKILASESRGPLPTFSAIGPNASACAETRAILTTIHSPEFVSTTVNHAELQELHAELVRETAESSEPFDADMGMIRAVYLAAHRAGVNTVLDGAGSDMLLSSNFHMAFLFRQCRFLQLLREAKGERQFWGPHFPVWRTLLAAAWQSYVPTPVRAIRFRRGRRKADKHFVVLTCAVAPFIDVARALARRKHVQRRDFEHDSVDSLTRVRVFAHPNVAVGRERYDRVAAAFGIEARDPFLDLRLIRFCLSLPRDQLRRDGWPKWILRRAMMPHVPAKIVWRRGKEHLGVEFTRAIFGELTPPGPESAKTSDAMSHHRRKIYLSNWFAYILKMRKIQPSEKKEVRVMKIENGPAPKRPYSAPKLIAYGDLATLTKGGTGSQAESPGDTPGDKFA